MADKPSFEHPPGAVYSETEVTVYIQKFFERFRAIEAQLALISEKLGIPYENPADAAMPREVVELVHAGKRLEAVKRYRQLTNASLNEAREAISGL
jgi:ribosomal protein L7/L12